MNDYPPFCWSDDHYEAALAAAYRHNRTIEWVIAMNRIRAVIFGCATFWTFRGN